MSTCDPRAHQCCTLFLRILATLLLTLVASPGLQAQTATTQIHIENHSVFPRYEWMKASVPFAPGKQAEPILKNINGRPTDWRVLQHWPDGSVKIAQAQTLALMAGKEKRKLPLLSGRIPLPRFQLHPAVAQGLPYVSIWTSVRDGLGNPYASLYRPLERSGQELLESNNSTIVLRSRGYHHNSFQKGIGRDFLSQTTYLQVYSGLPFATLDLIVSNDYLGADNPKSKDPNLRPLGDVAFQEIGLWTHGCEALVRQPLKNRTGPHIQGIFGPNSTHVRLIKKGYFGDGQGKHWRVILFFKDPSWSSAELNSWQQLVTGFADQTLIPVADWESWKRSGALGIFGSTAEPHAKLNFEISRNWKTWNQTSTHFGPFGAWGDHKNTSMTGTPRNGPHTAEAQFAAQSGRSEPLLQLEGISWAQQLRPYHLFGLKVGARDDIYLWDGLPYRITGGRVVSGENLGRLALYQKDPYKAWRKGVPLSYHHDFGAYDVEHFTVDHLFDYYSFTGDHMTREEIRHLGECLMGATRTFKYFSGLTVLTARAEGWAMQALVKCFVATGDVRYKNHAMARLRTVIEPRRKKAHASKALMFQGSHSATGYPKPHMFFMPWQHAAVIYGYMAAYRYFGDNLARQIAHDVLDTVRYSWVYNYTDPKFGFVPKGLRYYTPAEYKGKPVPANFWDKDPKIGVRWGDSPLGGAHSFLVAAMDVMAEDALSAQQRNEMLDVRTTIHHPSKSDPRQNWRLNKWFFLREPTIWK
ncbi:MAG: hypothetical protein CSA62_12950 [Planctomycetota bacterium]|nr:MAG: hypothetical protein CSA62_12950 [Planctomycetota bacterium]